MLTSTGNPQPSLPKDRILLEDRIGRGDSTAPTAQWSSNITTPVTPRSEIFLGKGDLSARLVFGVQGDTQTLLAADLTVVAVAGSDKRGELALTYRWGPESPGMRLLEAANISSIEDLLAAAVHIEASLGNHCAEVVATNLQVNQTDGCRETRRVNPLPLTEIAAGLRESATVLERPTPAGRRPQGLELLEITVLSHCGSINMAAFRLETPAAFPSHLPTFRLRRDHVRSLSGCIADVVAETRNAFLREGFQGAYHTVTEALPPAPSMIHSASEPSPAE